LPEPAARALRDEQRARARVYRILGIDLVKRRLQHGDVIANIELIRRRFTVEEYHHMAKTGILTEEDRVELIEGEIIQRTPIGQRHAACVARLARRLTQAFGDRALVWPQNPVRLPRDTEPHPDVVLLRPRRDDYFRYPARPEDVLLLIEVADVSYRYDRCVKLPLYAGAGVPEVWIIDLTHEVVEVHRQPTSRGYGSAHTVDRGGTLTPAAFDDVALAAADILPPS
jgi:Uma2 family endonuclease